MENPGFQKKFLVVDDRRHLDLRGIARQLQQAGGTTRIAASQAQAVEWLTEDPHFKVVILAASDDGRPVLLHPESPVPNGTPVQ